MQETDSKTLTDAIALLTDKLSLKNEEVTISYSALCQFLHCPYGLAYQSVPNENMQRGLKVHKLLENHIKGKQSESLYDADIEPWLSTAEGFVQDNPQFFQDCVSEIKFLVEWYWEDICRIPITGILDVFGKNPQTGRFFVLDWKITQGAAPNKKWIQGLVYQKCLESVLGSQVDCYRIWVEQDRVLVDELKPDEALWPSVERMLFAAYKARQMPDYERANFFPDKCGRCLVREVCSYGQNWEAWAGTENAQKQLSY